jgi:hypothetical protein
LPYRDVSHAAYSTQDNDDPSELKPEVKISKDEFLKHANVAKEQEKLLHSPDTEFGHDKENDVHFMYDRNTDVHHYYA